MSVSPKEAVGRATRFAAPAAFALAASVLAAGASGCSSLDPADESCVTLGLAGCDTPEGNGGTGGGTSQNMSPLLPAPWECLDGPPRELPGPVARVTYRIAIVDFDSQPPPNPPTAVEGLQIVVCKDPTCDAPAGPDEVTITNPNPQQPFVYDISMPYNFSNASLRISSTTNLYTDTEYFFGGPMVGSPEGGSIVLGQTLPVLRKSSRDTLYRGLGLEAPASAAVGDVAVRVLNCQRDEMGRTTRAANVRVEADSPSEGAIAYALTYGNLPLRDRDTDERGVAGFASLAPRNYVVRGIAPVGDGMPFGETTVPIRPGVITIVEIREGQGLWGQ